MKTLINIKADSEVKAHAQKLADELGLSLSALINVYLKHIIRNQEINFSLIPRMSPGLETVLRGTERDIKQKKNISKTFHTSAEASRYLDAL